MIHKVTKWYVLLIKTDVLLLSEIVLLSKYIYELFHCVSHHVHNIPFSYQNLSGILYSLNITDMEFL